MLHPEAEPLHPGRQSHLDEERRSRGVHQIQDVHPDHRQDQNLQSQAGSDAWDAVHREIAPVRPDSETDWDTAQEHPADEA